MKQQQVIITQEKKYIIKKLDDLQHMKKRPGVKENHNIKRWLYDPMAMPKKRVMLKEEKKQAVPITHEESLVVKEIDQEEHFKVPADVNKVKK